MGQVTTVQLFLLSNDVFGVNVQEELYTRTSASLHVQTSGTLLCV